MPSKRGGKSHFDGRGSKRIKKKKWHTAAVNTNEMAFGVNEKE